MKSVFKNIKAVGFDIDGTLYKSIPEMDRRIIHSAGIKLLEIKPELETIENAEHVYSKRAKELESGMRTLREFGYENATEVMAKILEDSNIIDLIQEDKTLTEIINKIADRYYVYIISTSPRIRAVEKLDKIGIDINIFNKTVFGDNELLLGNPKENAYRHILEETKTKPEENVYIGDRKISDIISPKSLGMRTIAVWKEIPEADISIFNIHQIEEILL